MISILKTFGLGLLCTILSPLILLIFILYFIYTLIGIFVMFCISVYRYFAKGGSVLDELEIEKKAKRILQAQEEYNQRAREAVLNVTSPINNTSPTYTSSFENSELTSTDQSASIDIDVNNQSPSDPYGGDSQ